MAGRCVVGLFLINGQTGGRRGEGPALNRAVDGVHTPPAPPSNTHCYHQGTSLSPQRKEPETLLTKGRRQWSFGRDPRLACVSSLPFPQPCGQRNMFASMTMPLPPPPPRSPVLNLAPRRSPFAINRSPCNFLLQRGPCGDHNDEEATVHYDFLGACSPIWTACECVWEGWEL